MQIETLFIGKQLRLRFNMGLDTDMNPIMRFRSWRNIKPTVTNEQLYVLGGYIGDICSHTLDGVRVVEENLLYDDA